MERSIYIFLPLLVQGYQSCPNVHTLLSRNTSLLVGNALSISMLSAWPSQGLLLRFHCFNVAMRTPFYVIMCIYSRHVLSFTAAISRLCMYILCGASSPSPHSIIYTLHTILYHYIYYTILYYTIYSLFNIHNRKYSSQLQNITSISRFCMYI